MTSAIESEWREWYRREYVSRNQRDMDISRTAYLAAAQRRDALTKLERDVIDAADAHVDDDDLAPDHEWTRNYARVIRAVAALRAARTPAPVDHLQEALTLIDRYAPHPDAPLSKARDHIAAELAAREAK